MNDNSVTPAANEGSDMRSTFNFNWGTICAIGIPLVIGGFSAYYGLQDQINRMDERAKMRIGISDQFQSDTKTKLDLLSNIPLRVTAVEEQQKNINQRLDQIADILSAGQEAMRRDLAAAIEPVRKDLAGVNTRLEVLADRVGPRKGDRVTPGAFRIR